MLTGPVVLLLAAGFLLSTPSIVTAISSSSTTTITLGSSPSSPVIELSPQPVYQDYSRIVSQNPINETHASVTFSGNGTLAIPNTRQTINTTSNGSALVSFATESAKAKMSFKSHVGEEETATITFYEIDQHPAGTTTGEGNGIAIGVVNTNTNTNDTSSGMLSQLNGMVLVGINEFKTATGEGRLTLWEWKS